MRQADPAEVMAELGFGEVHLVSSFAVSMSGAHCLSLFGMLPTTWHRLIPCHANMPEAIQRHTLSNQGTQFSTIPALVQFSWNAQMDWALAMQTAPLLIDPGSTRKVDMPQMPLLLSTLMSHCCLAMCCTLRELGKSSRSHFLLLPTGSGRSFTAYVFVKSDRAQQAQRNSLADASAAQPISPQLLATQKVVAESPSAISTPDIVVASRIPASQVPASVKTAATVSISVDARGAVVQPFMHNKTGKHQAGNLDAANGSCDAAEAYAEQERRETCQDDGSGKQCFSPNASGLLSVCCWCNLCGKPTVWSHCAGLT